MTTQQIPTITGSALDAAGSEAIQVTDAAKWEKWFQPGLNSGNYSENALKRCKEVNRDLHLDAFDPKRGNLSTMILQSSPIRIVKPKEFTGDVVREFIEKEQSRVSNEIDSKAPWKKTLSDLGYTIGDVVTKVKPIIDLFMPQSLEYTVPYGCLMIIFQGAAAKKEKKDIASALLRSLSDDLPLFDFYQILFPTDDMKTTVAMLYIQTLDLLSHLAEYFALGSLAKLGDALFPREKLKLSEFSTQIKTTATKLETLCKAGHVAETKTIRKVVESTDSALKDFKKDVEASLRSSDHELKSLRLQIGKLEYDQAVSDNASARRYISSLFDIWDPQVGAVENELQLWQKPRFFTDPRDHWIHNGILPCIVNWRELSFNSILWISSENHGRQSWMTEFSLDLLRVARSKGQRMTFALCDRPQGVRWTAEILMKQLICQLLHLNPVLAIEEPELFNSRVFRRADNFAFSFQLLSSILARLDSLLILIDRIDLCERHLDSTGDQSIVQALSKLTKRFPKTLKTIVTSGGSVNVKELSRIGISLAIINTRRRPHRRYEDDRAGRAALERKD